MLESSTSDWFTGFEVQFDWLSSLQQFESLNCDSEFSGQNGRRSLLTDENRSCDFFFKFSIYFRAKISNAQVKNSYFPFTQY